MVVEMQANNLANLLQCAKCGSQTLQFEPSALKCQDCDAGYPTKDGIPVFVDEPDNVKILSSDHVSNPIRSYVFEWLKQLDGCALNIGAGATQTKLPNVIEMEYAIFKNTDIVADAHHLPFQDEAFEAVIAFNVFEHLHDPNRAASEIFRVLKPGGKVIIHTAFLQPLHEEPFHFFNATKHGVMKWFSEFDIQLCQVSENFNPAFTIAWLSSELLRLTEQAHGAEVSERLKQTTIADWAKLWTNPESQTGLLWNANLNLPQELQERFAAGFELEAVKPGQGDGQQQLVCPLMATKPQVKLELDPLPMPSSNGRKPASSMNGVAKSNGSSHPAHQVLSGVDSVKLFATSLGNHFMIEIAYIYAEGFEKNGINAEIAIDKIPSVNPRPELMQIVIAPHEFFNLFLDQKLAPTEVREVAQAVYMLSGEQPFTPWFELFCQRAKECKGVLDITEQTTKAFRSRGLPAIHLPLGYASVFEAGVKDQPENQPNDLVFLGSYSPRRELFISRNADLFNRHNTHITITRLEKPKFLKTPGFYANEKRNQLLRSSKILINIHAEDNAYFEWLRVMMTLANRCLFMTELSDHIEPLINHKHIVMTDIEDIPAQCDYYLTHEDERLKIVNRAYDFVTRYFNTENICKNLLKQLHSQKATSKQAASKEAKW